MQIESSCRGVIEATGSQRDSARSLILSRTEFFGGTRPDEEHRGGLMCAGIRRDSSARISFGCWHLRKGETKIACEDRARYRENTYRAPSTGGVNFVYRAASGGTESLLRVFSLAM